MQEDQILLHLRNRGGCLDKKGYAALEELALDMQWSWNHRMDKIWHQLDPVLWEVTHNPWVVLQTVSNEKLRLTLLDPDFRKVLEDYVQIKQQKEQSNTWFLKNHPQNTLTCIAYFSMEYMLSEALPIYSGGLGNVAGDQLKAASDLGVPIIAVGLLYQQGYFRQAINPDGSQQALFPYNDPGQLPIRPLRKANGEWMRLEVTLPDWSLWIRVWKVQIGRVLLYLLDSNDPANFPVQRAITSELYGGNTDLRIKQEILLGIGGWYLFEELGIHPEVCHLNEGHAAFAILERIRCYMKKTGVSFEAALAITRAGNLFTTHTAVSAGFDRYPPSLIEQYFKEYVQKLGITLNDLLALGRQNPDDFNEPFNMAFLAMRGSGAVNAVSRLHGQVSRKIFEPLFLRWPESEVPVGYVTNGVHVRSWGSSFSDKLWTQMFGKELWDKQADLSQVDFKCVSDVNLWQMRSDNRKMLIYYMRKRLKRQGAARGFCVRTNQEEEHFFDENTLTIGFARRFATYKRPNMLLHDPERLIRLLNNAKNPIQILIAGKAHPADKPGQEMIKEWMHFIQRPEVSGKIVFLSDYDMLLTEKMVQGVDVWLNTPRRPWEACGTSGMKVLINGVLNLSELDGWWAEAYSPEVGWALGDGKEHQDNATWDAQEANALYELLENKVIPLFYKRNEEGIPDQWIEKMRESMGRLTLHYSANRTVREYTEKYYLPAAKNYHERTADHGFKGLQILDWKHALSLNWAKIRFGEFKIERQENGTIFDVQVYLNGLDPSFVKIELYHETDQTNDLRATPMDLVKELLGESNLYLYSVVLPKDVNLESCTARIVPFFPNVGVPLEENHVLWQK